MPVSRIDVSRPPAILDLNALSYREVANLAATLRRAQSRSEVVTMDEVDNFDSFEEMWRELILLRLEVRATFLDKMFERR